MKLCLTIGVSYSQSLSNLPGAVLAAKEMGDWAVRAGFKTEIVSDEFPGNPVTLQRVKEALLRLLPENDEVDLFILHFAGHGFRNAAEQHVWLPSDWKVEGRGISVDGLKNRLYRHAVKSLTIISDSCRSLPTNIDISNLIPDAVLPMGQYEPKPPVIDRFNAVLDGNTALMLEADNVAPARCVFSTVLIEGLYGLHEEAFSKYKTDYVLPESLARYSQERLKKISVSYGEDFTPDIALGSPIEHTFYLHRGNNIGEIDLPKWPAPPKRDVNLHQKITTKDSLPDLQISLEEIAFSRNSPVSLDGFEMLAMHPSVAHQTNLLILGKTPKKVWTAGVRAKRSTILTQESEYYVSVNENGSSQVLIEFEDDVFVSVVIFDDLITVVYPAIDKGFNWTFTDKEYKLDSQFNDSVNLISELQSGSLSAEMVDQIATDFRKYKHSNPTLGAISSYLYDYTGDIDSIRRMAYFYCYYKQAIPFDIAYMGLLKLSNLDDAENATATVPPVKAREKSDAIDSLPNWVTSSTKEITGSIAGYWPWLRQGWQFVEEPTSVEEHAAHGLISVIPYLLPSQFTSFKREGAEILIRKFNLEGNV